MLRPGGWTYIRRPNGETWLVVRRGWHDECFEIPKAITERFEALAELVASW